jgi:hypothetical protein
MLKEDLRMDVRFVNAAVFFRRAMALTLAISLAQSHFATADMVRLDEDLNVRTSPIEGQVGAKVGILRKGSLVSIPSRFLKSKNGKVSLDLATINNLQSSDAELKAARRMRMALNLPAGPEAYFSVNIVEAAPNSTVEAGCAGPKGEYFVALNYLSRRGKLLEVTQDAPAEPNCVTDKATTTAAVPAPEVVPLSNATRKPIPPSVEDAIISHEELGFCEKCDTGLPKNLRDLLSNAKKVEKQVLFKLETTRREKSDANLESIKATFALTCGFPLPKFLPMINRRASEHKVSGDIFGRLLRQESMGNCNAADGSGSLGLFQVQNSELPFCDAKQKSAIAQVSEMSVNEGYQHLAKESLKCVANPIAILDAGIKVWKQNEKRIFDTTVLAPPAGKLPPFNRSNMDNDDIRYMTALAYNKGEQLPILLRQAVVDFNKTHGMHLNPDKRESIAFVAHDRAAHGNFRVGDLTYSAELIRIGLSFAHYVAGPRAIDLTTAPKSLELASLPTEPKHN